MNRKEALLVFLLGYLMASAGVVWKFGEYGLMGAGVVLASLLFIVNVKE